MHPQVSIETESHVFPPQVLSGTLVENARGVY